MGGKGVLKRIKGYFFYSSGVINRKTYLFLMLAVFFLATIAGIGKEIIIGIAYATVGMEEIPFLVTAAFCFVGVVSVFIVCVCLTIYYCATVRRLRDRNNMVWWVVFAFIPMLNILMFFYLALFPSKAPRTTTWEDIVDQRSRWPGPPY